VFVLRQVCIQLRPVTYRGKCDLTAIQSVDYAKTFILLRIFYVFVALADSAPKTSAF
jgi:hypothetical protein